MTYVEPRTKCPLPIATKAMPTALMNLHQRLEGELVKAREGEAVLVTPEEAIAVLHALKTVLEFVKPKLNVRNLEPIRTRIPAGVLTCPLSPYQ